MKMIRYDSLTGERIEYEDISHAPPRDCFCPCCHYKTLATRGGFEICPVCFWEDDGQNDRDADAVRGGPNSMLSLTQARRNFEDFGACERSMLPNVRPPYEDETRRTEC
jgi:hypothetical protein